MCHSRSRFVTTWLLAVVLHGALTAQGVNFSMSAATSIPVSVQSGTQAAVSQLPAGPLGAFGSVGAGLPGGPNANVIWSVVQSAENLHCQVSASAFAAPLGAASCGPFDIVIELSSPTQRGVALRLERFDLPTPGQPWPSIDVDVGDDGVLEFPNLQSGVTSTVCCIDVGPVPLRIRLSLAVSALDGQVSSVVDLFVDPDNDVQIIQEAIACYVPGGLEVVPVYLDGGVDLHAAPGIAVIGFSAAPSLWGPGSVIPFAATCLLVPAPDVLLFLPNGYLHVPLPASLRPLQFHAQVVSPYPAGFASSDAFRIVAN